MREKVNCCRRPNRSFLCRDEEQAAAPDKMEVRKFDPVVRKHVAYKETKIK